MTEGDEIALLRRARDVFDAVVDLPPAAQAERVAAIGEVDPEVAPVVRRLLAADAGATDDPLEPLLSEEGDDALPARIGRFQVVRELGRGAMGVVYEAEQALPRRRVAIKTLLPLRRSPRALSQFRVEVDALGRVLHPGIPQIYEVFDTEDGVPAMVMERVEGTPLVDAIWLLDHARRAEVLAQIAEAVDHAHRHGVIHRDLKPDNVLVTPSGQPKVLDFGIARLDDTPAPRAGTLHYIAPEVLQGEPAGVAADVYGLGAVGWEMMTGEPPVRLAGGEDVDAMVHAKAAGPGAAADMPGPIEALLRQALALDPDARPASARRMAQALRDEAARGAGSPSGRDPRSVHPEDRVDPSGVHNFAGIDLDHPPGIADGGVGVHRVSAVRATADSLRGFGRLVERFDDAPVDITPWPVSGWRPLVPGTGDEGGTVEGTFEMVRVGGLQLARNHAVERRYITGWYDDPGTASEDREPRDPTVVLTHEANFHPDGGQVFFPRDGAPFVALLAPPGDDVSASDFVAFWFDGSRGVHIDAGVWHQPVFPVGGTAVFDDRQGAVHACVSVDFVREFGAYLAVPLTEPNG